MSQPGGRDRLTLNVSEPGLKTAGQPEQVVHINPVATHQRTQDRISKQINQAGLADPPGISGFC